MSVRRVDRMYCGAAGKITPERVARLDRRRHALQVKNDGAYGIVTTSADGSLTSITLRSGAPLGPGIAADFAGVKWIPSIVAAVEVEAFTERSVRAVEERGYRLMHAFDVLRIGRDDLSSLPQFKRRDRLMREQAKLWDAAPDRPWGPCTKTFTWAMPSDGAAPVKPTVRPLAAPGTMRPGADPLGWRRIVVTEQAPISKFDEEWSRCEAEDLEGLVVVATDAPVARRRSKLKCKRELTIDACVISSDRAAASLRWSGGPDFVVSATGRYQGLAPGTIVEVLCDHLHDRGEPKHPRITRVRVDLGLAVPQ